MRLYACRNKEEMQAPKVKRRVRDRAGKQEREPGTRESGTQLPAAAASPSLFMQWLQPTLAASSLRRGLCSSHKFSSGPRIRNPFSLSLETRLIIISGIIVFHEVCFDSTQQPACQLVLRQSDKTLPISANFFLIRNKRFTFEFVGQIL